MKIVWVKRRPVLEGGGDAIVDARFVRELSKAHEVIVYTVERRPRAEQVRRILTRGVPPDRGSFGTPEDVERIAALVRDADALVASHEQLDALVADAARRLGPMRPYTALLLHNVPSDALPQVAGNRLTGWLAGRLWTAYESRSFARPEIDEIFTLSRRDARLVAALTGRGNVPVFHPGAPPDTPLASEAVLKPDLVVIGTFEWFPKHRDMLAFAQAFASERSGAWQGRPPQVYLSDGAGPELTTPLQAQSIGALDFAAAIRFGLVTDRFVSGHKLKVSEYFARNLIPLSFSAVDEDFCFSTAACALIKHVDDVPSLAARMAEMAAMPPEGLHTLFMQAKREVLDTLSWHRQSELMSAHIHVRVAERQELERSATGVPVRR